MLETNQNQLFESALFQSTGKSLTVKAIQFVSGGCINNAVKLDTNGGIFFFKWNQQQPLEMFETEAKGLQLLIEANALKVPEMIGFGEVQGTPYLLLEFLNSAYPDNDYWEQLGRGLATIHRKKANTFGLDFNNYIGALPQRNQPTSSDWLDFFIENRLKVQFGKAFYEGLIAEKYLKSLDRLAEKLKGIFPDEPPSLLHGDLWSGNVMPDGKGQPAIIDPAVYFGHREMELAFTKLFGGFEPSFYAAYEESYPLEKGFTERVALYNLYPLMVHVNLFGMSYFTSVERTLKKWGVT